MARIHCVILALLLVCVLVHSRHINIKDVLEKVPQDGILEFLKYHIRKGHDLVQDKEPNLLFPVMTLKELPDEFSITLYKYALKQGLVSDPVILRILKEVICFEDGTCIDIGDIGVHP